MKMKLTRKELAIMISLLAACPVASVSAMVSNASALITAVAPENEVTGVVSDAEGYPLPGVKVQVKGTQTIAVTDIDGKYSIRIDGKTAQLVFSYIGCKTETKPVTAGARLNVTMKDEPKAMDQVVVTAMGILRKEKTLTYATQSIKAEDLQKVPSIDATTGLEGKISGLTITPSAGGAGGSSKILLRGNNSIMGNNEPLIVVDGVPMNNDKHGSDDGAEGFGEYASAGGGDALSLINPDDIESINFLKGANAAALYGSQAANGVVMITTKKGRVGKLDVSLTSNVQVDMALSTPRIQNQYGAAIRDNYNGTYSIGATAWGNKVVHSMAGAVSTPLDPDKFAYYNDKGIYVDRRDIHLTNVARNNVSDFYRPGTTLNNSVALSGGTEKVKTYVSIANSHATGIVQNNSYNRNSVALRQAYALWDRGEKKWFNSAKAEISLNYVEARTNNRISGGTVQNPIYHLYMAPANIDMAYYKSLYSTEGTWRTNNQAIFEKNSSGGYDLVRPNPADQPQYTGTMQNWAYQAAKQNNPYALLNMNQSHQKEMRVYGYGQANISIYDGLSFQARFSLNKYKYNTESNRYAGTWAADNMYDFGTYSKGDQTSTEMYVDYLLSYNKIFKKDWSLSATVGYVGHTIKGEETKTYVGNATMVDPDRMKFNQGVNIFDVSAGGVGTTSTTNSSAWDQAALATVQLGWKDAVYVDGSYREDWYRPFKQFASYGTPTHYGYFGVGGSVIISSLTDLPEWFSYLKGRLSYSQVGNSIPNKYYYSGNYNYLTGATTVSNYIIENPRPETTKSFELGFETMFLDDRLSLDVTYYNSALHNMYIETGSSAGKVIVSNSALVRNQGVELTAGYNFKFGKDWRWKTSVNYSYNYNEIEKTAYDEKGSEKKLSMTIANCVQVPYKSGTAYGEMYVSDFARYKATDPEVIADPSWLGKVKVGANGNVTTDTENPYSIRVGNMYSPHQLGWSNNISWKNFSLSFLINGRIGGHIVDLTEAYLDMAGMSQRTADARNHSDAMGWTQVNPVTGAKTYMMHVPGAPDGQLSSVEGYYNSIGSGKIASQYAYSATNFRLRELTFGYMFRDLLGAGNHLSLSFVARNLFFIYRDSPSDPDVAMSTGNSLSGVACFNFPSTRTFGFSAKLNFGVGSHSSKTSKILAAY
ncbi:MAG: SusC/RagA family TonB-linked outer membrane protein [Bacteroidaceae bacterium]|nr:SusC/RagA family TonB-linked outer membrane protein [Bacteroidaceae bacterium]